jgi:MOSC domain-containing protein YiiM
MPEGAAPLAQGTVESVNTGDKRLVKSGNRIISTAIWKSPVEGRVPVRGVHVGEDVQADTSVHGGPDKAVYAYARAEYDLWASELGQEMVPGNFGENLTLEGVPVSGAVIGERWRAGTALLEVCQPRIPCAKLGLRMGEPRFTKWFAERNRPGAYLRIIEEGDVGAGDAVEVLSRPEHGVTSALVSEALLSDHSLAPRLIAATQLPDQLREWAIERAETA